MLNCTDIMAVLEKLELPEILSNPTVMSLAVGSPGQAIAHYQQLRSIPQSLLVELCKPLSKALAAMQTAKDIALKTSVNSITEAIKANSLNCTYSRFCDLRKQHLFYLILSLTEKY